MEGDGRETLEDMPVEGNGSGLTPFTDQME